MPGWVPSRRDGYDTMVILRLLFTSRKSRQSSSFSLPRRGAVRGRDPPSPSTAGCEAAPRGCRPPPCTHLISFCARSRSPWDRLWLVEARKSWRYTEQSCRFMLATACSSLSQEICTVPSLAPPSPVLQGQPHCPPGWERSLPAQRLSLATPYSLQGAPRLAPGKYLVLEVRPGVLQLEGDKAQRQAAGTPGQGPHIPTPTWMSCPLSFFTNLSMRCRSSARNG